MIKKWFNIITQKIYNKQFALCILLVLFCCLYLTSPSYADTCPSMAVLKERYQGDCFPCKIVNVLLSSFMRAAGQVYDVSKAAGNKLLLLGSALWIAFWALKKMISFARVEPADMAKELLNFLGKVLIAYCFVNAGIGTLVSYAINPILGAGAEFGTALLLETEDFDTSSKPIEDNQYQGPTEIVSASVMNKILKLSEGVSNEVATNYIVGSGLTCFAFQQGFSLLGISVPDIWMWLCGAAIWCVGFMLTLAVCYYLIDIPFKIGFAVMALPVVIGLWPFKITEDKLKSIIMIAVNAAGTFLFLALSSSYAIRLMMEAFSSEGELPYEGKTYSGKEALFKAFETDNVEYVEGLFDLTGPGLLIVLFCYIYGFKMISEITTKYPDKFFSGSMTAAAGNPLHQMATAATGWVGSKIAAPFKTAVDIAAYQAGKAATTAVKATANVAGAVVKRGAGAVTRAAGRSIAKASSSAVNKQRSLKTAADSLDRQNSLNNAGLGTKIGGKLGKLQASMGLKMAESVNKLGQKMEKSGDNMVQSSKDPFKRIVQAAKAGGKEWKDAAVDLGQSLAEVGSSVTPNKAVEAMQNNPNLQKISNTVMQNKQNMRQQGDLSFKRSVVKFKQSGGQLVNRFVNAGNAVKTTFSKDGKIAQKVASFKGKSFSEIRKDIGSAIAKPFVEAHAKTREDVLRSKENYANRISGFGSTFKNKAQLSQAELIELLKKLYPDQFAEDFLNQYADLKETTKGLKNTITDETGIQGTKGAAASMATGTALGLAIAKNLGKNFQHGIDYVKEGEINSIGTAIGSGVIRPAAALTMALADSASDTLESTYRLSEQSLLTGISLAQTVASPLKTVGRSLTYGAFAIGDAGMAVGSVGLNGVGLATGVLNVGYQYSKYVTRPVLGVPLQGAGALVGLAAKTVDNTLYAGYKSVETLAMAGKTLGLGANVLYHGLKDHTIAGQAISKTFKAGSKTLALAGKTLKLGRNIIRAAAGENIGIGDDRGEKQKDKMPLSDFDKEQLKQEKQKQKEKEKKEKEKKEKEEKEKQDLLDRIIQEREQADKEYNEQKKLEKENWDKKYFEKNNSDVPEYTKLEEKTNISSKNSSKKQNRRRNRLNKKKKARKK